MYCINRLRNLFEQRTAQRDLAAWLASTFGYCQMYALSTYCVNCKQILLGENSLNIFDVRTLIILVSFNEIVSANVQTAVSSMKVVHTNYNF